MKRRDKNGRKSDRMGGREGKGKGVRSLERETRTGRDEKIVIEAAARSPRLGASLRSLPPSSSLLPPAGRQAAGRQAGRRARG